MVCFGYVTVNTLHKGDNKNNNIIANTKPVSGYSLSVRGAERHMTIKCKQYRILGANVFWYAVSQERLNHTRRRQTCRRDTVSLDRKPLRPFETSLTALSSDTESHPWRAEPIATPSVSHIQKYSPPVWRHNSALWLQQFPVRRTVPAM